jgi:hypothetical protein
MKTLSFIIRKKKILIRFYSIWADQIKFNTNWEIDILEISGTEYDDSLNFSITFFNFCFDLIIDKT